MSKPEIVAIEAEKGSWVSRLNANFGKIVNAPFPILSTATETTLNASFNPKLYKNALVVVEFEDRMYQSDGENWIKYPAKLAYKPAAEISQEYTDLQSAISASRRSNLAAAETAAYADGNITTPEINNIAYEEALMYMLETPILSRARDFGIKISSLPAASNQIPTQDSPVTGVRTSDTLFTRSSGTWVASEHVDDYAFFYNETTSEVSDWFRIYTNGPTILNMSGTIIPAGATHVIISKTNIIEDTYDATYEGFHGVVLDSNYLWLNNGSYVSKFLISTGAYTHYAITATGDWSGPLVSDGTDLWMIPYDAPSLVKVTASSGAMTEYTHSCGSRAFSSGLFDGTDLWLIPYASDYLVRVTIATGAMEKFSHGQGDEAFKTSVFDGTYLWLIPYKAADLIRVDITTGDMTTYPHSESTNGGFKSGVFDGTNLWLIPWNATNIVKVDPATGDMTKYTKPGLITHFTTGILVGTDIWLVPFGYAYIVKIDTVTDERTSYQIGDAGTKGYYTSAVSDGLNIWMCPSKYLCNSYLRVDTSSGETQETIQAHSAGNHFTALWDGNRVWFTPGSQQTNMVGFYPQERLSILAAWEFYANAKSDTALTRTFFYADGLMSGAEITAMAQSVTDEELAVQLVIEAYLGETYTPGTAWGTVVENIMIKELMLYYNELLADLKAKNYLEATP